MGFWPWRRRSTVARREAQDRLEQLILEASLAAKRTGDDALAVDLWDASRKMRWVIPRETWRSLSTYSDAQLHRIVELMIERR